MSSSWKNPSFREHRRCSSIGSPMERIVLPRHQSNQLSKSNNSSYDAGFEKDKGLKMTAGTLPGSRSLVTQGMIAGDSAANWDPAAAGEEDMRKSSPTVGKSRSMSHLSSSHDRDLLM